MRDIDELEPPRDTQPMTENESSGDVFTRLDHVEGLLATLAGKIDDCAKPLIELARDIVTIRAHFHTVNRQIGEHERRITTLEERLDQLTRTSS